MHVNSAMVQVMFICNHCPFVKHLKKSIVKLANFYMKVRLTIAEIFFLLRGLLHLTVVPQTSLCKGIYDTNLFKCVYLCICYNYIVKTFSQKGLAVVAISSNSVATHPQVLDSTSSIVWG